MNTLIKAVILAIISFLMTNCTKEINEEVSHEAQTVILGSISNETAPVVVNIQETVPLRSTSTFNGINNASVTIYEKDNANTTRILTNTFTVVNGTYTSTTPIATVIGNSYWVEIELSDGTVMRSEEEELKPVVPILELDIEDKEVVKVRFSDPENETNFYEYRLNLWNNGVLAHTHRVESNDVLFDGNDNAFVELYRFDEDDNEVIHDTVEVLLAHINLSSYSFYFRQSIEEDIIQNEDGGTDHFFATPPANLFGNITNSATGKKVLGNFTVNAISEFRKDVE